MAKILLVDDEADIVTLTRAMLERADYEVVVARNGKECLEKLKEEKIDLVLLDVMMPGGLDGWEVCKKIKEDEKTKDLPVVMFTVCSEPWSVELGREAGAEAQVSKPFEVEELLGTVEKVLGENKDRSH
jgi:CheY-like chemotaxis protein